VAESKQGDNNTEDVTGSGIGGVVRKVASDRELNRLLWSCTATGRLDRRITSLIAA
jgi:hypothetical protein